MAGAIHWDQPMETCKARNLGPAEAREGIVMIGLFGAMGTARFDGIEIKLSIGDRFPRCSSRIAD